MIEIFFRRRGGSDYADLRQKLTPDQFAYLQSVAGEEPIVAMMSSERQWFVITKSCLAVRSEADVRRVPLTEIHSVAISNRYSRDIRKFENIKIDGGEMDIGIQDGAEFNLTVKPGGPYLGVMNVLMRLATLNGRRSDVERVREALSRTTNDRGPTPQS